MTIKLLSPESPLIRRFGVDFVCWTLAVLVQALLLSLLALFGPSHGRGGGHGSGSIAYDATFDTAIHSTDVGSSGSAFVLNHGQANSPSDATQVAADLRTPAVEQRTADPKTRAEPKSDSAAGDVSDEDSELLLSKLNGLPTAIGRGHGEGESGNDAGRGRNFGRGDGTGRGNGVGRGGSPSFFGIPSSAKKLEYVIDRSDSMAQHDALTVVKAELLASLDELPPDCEFAVLFFNKVLTPFLPRADQAGACLVRGTTDNKALVNEFVKSVLPEGGTDRMAALRGALALNPDAIYLLTDADEPLLYAGDLEQLRRANRRRIPIHVVEFGRGTSIVLDNFLTRLARETHAKYTYLDISKFVETKTANHSPNEK